MKPGQAVKYRALNGSIGVILSQRHYDDGFYVEWCYGLDARKERWISISSVPRDEIVVIPKRLYREHSKVRAFSKTQKKIYNKIVQYLQSRSIT